MRSELEKYGIQMPAFSKIGGILADELSVDEAACEFLRVDVVTHCSSHKQPIVNKRTHGRTYFCHFTKMHVLLSPVHAAVIAINEAIDRGQASVTMGALNNPNAMLKNIEVSLAQDYQDELSRTKAHKQDLSAGRVRS